MDATLEFLQTLNDESKWVVRRGVPIFKPHVRKDPKTGAELYTVTAADMPVIAENMANLEKVGVYGRITPGHVLPANAEEDQPSLYGFMKNARPGTFGPAGEPCVLVDQYLKPKYAAKAGELPFRSAEYYHGMKTIRGLALLIRDPYLDMGVVTYATAAGICYSYEAEPTAKPPEPRTMEPNEEEKKSLESLMQKYKAYMCQKYNLKDSGEPPAPAPKPGFPPELPEAVKLHLETQATQYAAQTRLQTEAMASLHGEIKRLRTAHDGEHCRRLLTELATNYEFDIAEETATLLSFSDEPARTAHIERIKKRYQKKERPPTGPGIPIDPANLPQAEAYQLSITEEAQQYCRENPGTDFLKKLDEIDKARTAAKK